MEMHGKWNNKEERDNDPGYKAMKAKKKLAKNIVGMKDIQGGKKNSNNDADSFARTKAVATSGFKIPSSFKDGLNYSSRSQ